MDIQNNTYTDGYTDQHIHGRIYRLIHTPKDIQTSTYTEGYTD
jgi:hypothetical protein